jgi:hypothetical protein
MSLWVQRLEGAIERAGGPRFRKIIGQMDRDYSHRRYNSSMLRWVSEALRTESGADLALEVGPFVSMAWSKGLIHEVDAFNAHPSVYSHETKKAWQTHVVEIRGSALARLFAVLLSPRSGVGTSTVSGSGIEVVFRPWLKRLGYTKLESFGFPMPHQTTPWLTLGRPVESLGLVIKGMTINGQPYSGDRLYKVAVSSGMLRVLEILDRLVPGRLVRSRRDTGQETWRQIASWIEAQKSLVRGALPAPVWRHEQLDLAINREGLDFEVTRGGLNLSFENQGNPALLEAVQPKLTLYWNARSAQPGRPENWRRLDLAGAQLTKDLSGLSMSGIRLPERIQRLLRAGRPLQFRAKIETEGDAVDRNDELEFWYAR